MLGYKLICASGTYKGRAIAPRKYACLFPAFLDLHVEEMHLEMASREFAELELIEGIVQRMDVAVGIIDVKSYYIETPRRRSGTRAALLAVRSGRTTGFCSGLRA